MGLSYLTKKNWNPSNMNNVRSVWEAEHREELKKKQRTEREKILKEEKQIEDLKRLQVKEGIIPQSSLTQIEWMYQDRSAFNKDEKTAEEFLLGKEVTERDLAATKATVIAGDLTAGEGGNLASILEKTDQQLVESFTTNENEAFLRMKEDPLVLIKQKELEQRQQVYSNPMVLKKIQKEIQMLKDGSRSKSKKKDKEKKKHKKRSKEDKIKKKKKHGKKDKKHRRHRSSSSSSSSNDRDSGHRRRRSRSHSSDSDVSRKNKRHKRDSSRQRRRSRSRSLSSDEGRHYSRTSYHPNGSKPDYYSRSTLLKDHHQSSNSSQHKQSAHQKSNDSLGPDMALYGGRLNQIKEMDKLRREKVDSHRKKEMTMQEKEARLVEMQAASMALRDQRRDRSGYTAASHAPNESDQEKSGAKFLSKMRQDVYMDSEMNLEERMNRQKHYRDRKDLRKDVAD